MGKGKRIREERKDAVDPKEALGLLLEVETKEDFLRLVAGRPALIRDPVLRQLSQMADAPYGAVFDRWLRLVEASRADPAAAWDDHAAALARDNATGEELGRVTEEAQEAERKREYARVIDLIEPAVAKAMEAGLTPGAAVLEALRAHAYLNLPTGSRQDNIDKAVSGFGRAITMTLEPEEAARLRMYIGIAMAERVRDDPADNIEAALNAMREGLEMLPAEGSPDLRATIKSNIATTLLRRQRGERIADLGEARDLCQEVLQHRSLNREPDEWAVVQLNLAPILQELARLNASDPREAEAVYREVIDASEMLGPDKVANAHHQLGRMLRISVGFDPEAFVEAHLDEEGDEGAEQIDDEKQHRVLAEAREHLEAAVNLYPEEQLPLPRGRAYVELADVFNQLEEPDSAIAAAESGLRLLPPTSDPRECTRVAGRLGDLLGKRGQWDGSAAAFRIAVEASELALNSRLDSAMREEEMSATLNLTRWAAYAIARAGEIPEALLILESGRARDLRLRLELGTAGSAELSELPEDLRARYVLATETLARSPLGEAGAGAARSLREVLREIRRIGGFEDFATRANESDLLAAAEKDWPVVYVNPTPAGTMLIILERGEDGGTADVRFLEKPTGVEILMRLLAGDGAENPDLVEAAEYGSFLSGASGYSGVERDIQKDVEHVLPWLGEYLAAPLHELLDEVGARGVTLVPCGPVALAPLHCAPWTEDGEVRYLVDDFEIRHAPSGAFAATSLGRAQTRDELEPNLVALVNPEQNLSAAKPEFDGVSLAFAGRVEHAEGAHANWEYLQTHARDASFLHLACHARSGVWGESLPAVLLADGAIEVTRLTELAGLESRLVAVSACQTGVVDITHLPEEGLSVGTAFLAAGSACVIASLWPVRDDTTALLMTRLYGEMIDGGQRPPEALRRAQLWLRDLTDPELANFLIAHPTLEAEFSRRAAAGDRPGQRAAVRRGSMEVQRPFSGPDYWAPFVALGA
ncbi:MAG TPA: CHAT domain-containing protein [Solirubrobacterales bacterium]|jgi:CHAT domain-containing protein/tetratricopeptide (TPR) repeat protein